MEKTPRERIEAYLRETPGPSTRMVAQAAGVDDSTADYHLRRLRKQGHAQPLRSGRELTWWHADCGHCPVQRRAIPSFRRSDAARLASALSASPLSVPVLSERTGLTPFRVRWNLAFLEEAGLARRDARGRAYLVTGAQTCVRMVESGAACAMWGRCPVSATPLS